MVLALLFAPSTFIHLGKLVSADDLVPLSIEIKPNFITVSHLHGSWFNPVMVRGLLYTSLTGLHAPLEYS